jgi:hypothetical protein
MARVVDPGRSERTGDGGFGVFGDFGAGRRCFVAKVTPEDVWRDLAREAAGNLAKRSRVVKLP